jgi:hypothetical protein
VIRPAVALTAVALALMAGSLAFGFGGAQTIEVTVRDSHSHSRPEGPA